MLNDYFCLKYDGKKWLCSPSNDNLDCEDCLYSKLIIKSDKL